MNPHFFTAPFYYAFIWFKVQGSRGGFVAFFIGRCQEVAFKSPVTSRSHDTGEGIVSHMWHEILRLSPHLFRLGLFTHRAVSSAQDDDTRGRKGSHRIGRMDGEFIFPIAAFL